MMWVNTQNCISPVFIVGIVAILALSTGPSCSLALDGRHLLEGISAEHTLGAEFRLKHWSHPDAPHHIPGLSFTEKVKFAVQNSRARVAAVSSRMHREAEVVSTKSESDATTSNDTYVSPVKSLIGEYGMEISIGTPPQNFSAIADTGSDLVWVQCSCEYCDSQPDPFYNLANSSTYEVMSSKDPLCGPVEYECDNCSTCEYAYGYGSGASFGIMAYETVTVTTTTGKTTPAKHFAFGCDMDTYLILDYSDGLVGLGQGPLSFSTQLGDMFGHKFSYCLVSIYDSNTTTSPLLFGEGAIPKGSIQYTPMLTNPNASYFGAETYYYIGLEGIQINGVALDIPPHTFDIKSDGTGGTVIDSGTTFTFLTEPAYYPLLDAMQQLISYPVIPGTNETIALDLCYDLTNVSSPIFPVVTMVFGGLDLVLPQENVFIGGLLLGPGYNSTTSTYCLAFANTGTGFDSSIFGNVQQENFQILYDREARRYGFSEVECSELC